MLPNQMPIPPTDMVMPPEYHGLLVSTFVVTAAVLVWLLFECKRTRSPIPIYIFLGGAITALQECIFDVLCLVWYPQTGHTPLYRMFNSSVPLWMLGAYPCYVGGLGYLMLKKFRTGMTTTVLWTCYLSFWLANLLIELPGLHAKVYTYYGDQPFEIFGFPLWMAVTNSLMPIVIGLVLNFLSDVLHGARAILIIALTPMLAGGTTFGAAWPVWLGLHSGGGYLATYAGALITTALAISTLYLIGKKCCLSARTYLKIA
jgi:hypothetical protein